MENAKSLELFEPRAAAHAIELLGRKLASEAASECFARAVDLSWLLNWIERSDAHWIEVRRGKAEHDE